VLDLKGYNANKTVERLLNAITRVELTNLVEDKSDNNFSNGNNSKPIPNIIINNNGEKFKDYIKKENKLPISSTLNIPPPYAPRTTLSIATINLFKKIPYT